MGAKTVISNSVPRKINNNNYNVRVITGGTVEGKQFTGNATLFGYDVSVDQYNEAIKTPGAERYLIPGGAAGNPYPLYIFGQTRNNQIVPIDDTNNPIINSLILDSNQNKTQLINAEKEAIAKENLVVSPTDTTIDPNAAKTSAPGEQPPPQGSSTGGGTRVGTVTRGTGISVQADITRKHQILTYPSDMDSNQDRIKFTVWESKKNLSGTPQEIINGLLSAAKQSTLAYNHNNYYKPADKESRTVYLPITRISDTNTVQWTDDSINALQLQVAAVAAGLMSRETQEKSVDRIGVLLDKFGNDPAMGNMVRLYLSGEAVSAANLLQRATGGIFNPNLELLFTSPQLRSFQFNVGMISRNKEETTRVKEIINFFKKNMAARVNENNLFLNSPYVFLIEYLTSGNKVHQSLNQIKMCALQACNVDYTPMGSYMTFNDTDNTMFMYNLTLQFKELHPIYDVDYGSHPIGY